jgi:tetratricopeptide (TPR) repeat protein
MHALLRFLAIGALLALAAAVCAFVWKSWSDQQARAGLEHAQKDLAAGRYFIARKQLDLLSRNHPGHASIHFHLGVAARAIGDIPQALAAWEKVPESHALGGWALQHRAEGLTQLGRFTQAEELLRKAIAHGGSQIHSARWDLVKLLRLEGRIDEAREIYLQGESESPDPISFWKRLYSLDTEVLPEDALRASLELALRQSPQDPRVWLGLARLELRAGHADLARNWLARCLAHAPDDLPNRLAELDHAVVTADLEALHRIARWFQARPALQSPLILARLLAPIARLQSDRPAERDALTLLLEAHPNDVAPLDRLAELALEDNDPELAARFRQRKSNFEADRLAFTRLMSLPDPRPNALEIAALATRLGRTQDAAGWARLARTTPSTPNQTVRSPIPTSTAPSLVHLTRLLDSADAAREPRAPARLAITPLPRFEDRAQAAGLDFVHQNGGAPGRLIPPVTASGGLALLDFNTDGWLDLYVVQAGPFPPRPDLNSANPDAGDRLYRNRGDGTFEDVTASAGLAGYRGYGHGVAVGDVDNDGFPDLFITRWRSYALYRNRGDGTFEDVTAAWGLDGERDWPTSAAFADLDNDGDLDLYVCHYLKWNEGEERVCSDPEDPAVYRCAPRDFPALPDHLFRNDRGRFTDVSTLAGITAADADGRGLGVVAADLDDDGRVDLFVANDTTANYLFRNLGNMRFEEIAHTAGVASNATGGYQAGMGTACADLDRDGRLDLAVTNFYGESTTFFHNLGNGFFADHSAAVNLAAPTRNLLGFGLLFLDANNDGSLDLFSANGHIHDGRPMFPWTMPAQLLLMGPDGRFQNLRDELGPPFAVPHIGRGLVSGDLDHDGRLDVVLLSQSDPLVLFSNQTPDPGRFLVLQLEGTRSNRDAVGARVIIQAENNRWVAERTGGGSFQSASSPLLHLGLGLLPRIDRLEIRWPSGHVDQFTDLPTNQALLAREAGPALEPLKEWKSTSREHRP